MKARTLRTFLVVLSWTLLLCVLSACGHSHNFGSWETEEKATCSEAGTKERSCRCGETETKEIPKLDHKYREKITREASCAESGEITYTCKNCDDSYTETFEAQVYTSTEIYDMYLNSVGEIVVYDKNGYELGLGTCFVYTEDGQLITNYHVIEGAHSAKVTLGEETYQIQQVLAYDRDIDVAVLEISESGLTPANLCSNDHSVGETVYAFGNSRGLTGTFSDGMITYSCREVDGVDHVQHDAPISSGNSGGPLINQYGEVIGINTWTVVDSQNLNFAIHISELDNLSFDNAMTMAEFYKEDHNAFRVIKDYALANSTNDDGMYWLTLYETYGSGSYYSIDAIYDEIDETVKFLMCVDAEFYVYFIVEDDVSGVYEWNYFDDYDNDMTGTLDADSFNSNKTLTYTYSNEYGESRETTIALSTAMMDYMCTYLDDALKDIGLTAQDFGFTYY